MSLALTLASAQTARSAVPATVPAVAELCGWLAGGIGIVTGWPQVWRLWVGRRHEGLSLTANLLGVLYATAWLLYGVATHSVVMVSTNVVGICVLIAVLAGHLRLARPPVRDWAPLLVVGLTLLGLIFEVGARPLGLTASAATIGGVAPQVVLLARSRRTGELRAGGVSRTRWMLSCVANLLWVSYGGIVGDPVVFFNSLVIASLAAAIVYLAADRRNVPITVPFEPEFAIAA